jgi:hypothetical protein
MPLAGFEATVPANDRAQIYALDRVASGTGDQILVYGPAKLNKLLELRIRNSGQSLATKLLMSGVNIFDTTIRRY